HFTALFNEELKKEQVIRYYTVIRDGIESTTLWNESIVILPQAGINIESLEINEFSFDFALEAANTAAADYPEANANYTSCNYTSGRNHNIDTWVNHWIGTGTYLGAISWFHNCSAQASAHFVIRASDGEITQVVRTQDTAWHAGAFDYNNRSIGVEHEATLANPELWNSVPMLQASANMARYFANLYSIPSNRGVPGIVGHNEIPGTSTQCPGNLPWDQWMSFFAGMPIVYEFWRKADPLYADPNSDIWNPNFDAQYKVVNNGNEDIYIDSLALSVHDADDNHLFDLSDSDTGQARYYDNLVLTSGETHHFVFSVGYIQEPGTYKLVAKAQIDGDWHHLASQDFVMLEALDNEICNDGIDNDGDSYIDCDDFDCTNNSACPVMTDLTSGQQVSGSVSQDNWKQYKITASSSDTELQVDLTNLSADVDLYVRKDSSPTETVYDCRPYKGGTSSESCTLTNSGATEWYISVYGYQTG
ncbi:MAG: hypothetical protein D3905_16115, partial [Candidatus Electrothrix sp. AS4_5]|nr:hypothetical protein [Candidatus Electrothrix gigas]